jgi:tRNA pseudouridine65 synthase
MAIEAGLDETWLKLLERFAWADAYAAQVEAWKTAT